MIRLLFIVPYPELREKVELVLANHPKKNQLIADVRVMTVEETPDVPERDYDAIIARGFTAQKTSEKYQQIPTIELSISGFDIINAISECCEIYHPSKIALLGFNTQMYEVKSICRLFHTDVVTYAPVPHEALSRTVAEALKARCDALIGGYSATIIARQHKLPAVIIKTGEAALLQAANEAIHTVGQIRHQRQLSQMYKTIIYSSKDGVLYINKAGIIQVRNENARRMNGGISLLNQPLKKTLPYLYPVFCTVVKEGKEETGRVMTIPGTKIRVSASYTPVIVNQEVTGVVLNLSDITIIQDLESQIRRKLSERGLKARYKFPDIIHRSVVIDRTIEKARRYAAANSNIIIIGETGTGKELFSQSIHNSSERRNGPFVAINCAALPENLLESELFGYVEGAFTGTSKGGKMGLFEQAHGGTLFLDEIDEISLSTQSKLLRVLQEQQVRRIGDNRIIDINVRIVAATNKSIFKLSEQGKFRQDLLYRLDVLRLFLPPLRARETDIELLFRHFLKIYSQEAQTPVPAIDPDAIPLLYQYPFLGNIRELKNIVERVSVVKQGDYISKDDLQEALYPEDLDLAVVQVKADTDSGQSFSDEPERLFKALKEAGGNRTKAAAMLGIDRSTLWRKLKKYSQT